MQAEHHLGEAEPRVFNGNPHLAGERDFEAAAEAETVNHGDRRNFQFFQAIDHGMRTADLHLDRAGIGWRRGMR